MTRGRINAPVEPPLFDTETVVTRDEWFDSHEGWGTRAQRPAGNGWTIADFLSSEKLTRWERRIPRGQP
jgi:hypothetical protein